MPAKRTMFEWHGWASIRGNFTVDDDEDAEREDRERRSAVERLLANQPHFGNEIVDIRYVNGACHVWLSGGHNPLAKGRLTFSARSARQHRAPTASCTASIATTSTTRGSGGSCAEAMSISNRT